MRKKRKNDFSMQQKKNAAKSIRKNSTAAISEAARIAETTGGYCHILKVQDEKEFRRIENSLTSIEKSIFRAMMLKRVPSTPNDPGGSTSTLDILMRADTKCLSDAFSYTASEIIGEYVRSELSKEDGDGYPTRAVKIAERIPSEFRSPTTDYAEVILLQPLADAFTKTINSIIDWEKALPGANVFSWSKAAFKLLDTVCGSAFLEKYSMKRGPIFEAAARGVAAAILDMDLIPMISNVYPQYKPIKDNGKSVMIPRAGNFNPTIIGAVVNNAPHMPAMPNLPPKIAPDSNETDPATETNICGLLAPLVPKSRSLLDKIGQEMVKGRFSPIDIIFTIVDTCKDLRDIKELPTFIDTLLFTATQLMPLAVCHSTKDFENKVHRPDIVIHSTTMLTAPDRELGEEDIRKKATSLAQLILKEENQIVAPELHIPSTFWESFTRAGYTEIEAAAICGLMRGLSYCSDNQILYHKTFLPYIHDPVAEEDVALNEEDIRSNIENEMRESIEQTKIMRQEVEVARSQFLRERRTTIYRADRAEQDLSECMKQLEEAQKKIRILQNENKELQTTIFDMSHKDSGKDTETTLQFPLDIAKDIRFSVFGGPQNWVQEQKKRFPNVYFYDVDTYPQPDIVENSDIIMCNTFVMSHKYFNNIQDIAKKKGIPLHFIRNRGINNGSRQIFEAWDEHEKANRSRV